MDRRVLELAEKLVAVGVEPSLTLMYGDVHFPVVSSFSASGRAAAQVTPIT